MPGPEFVICAMSYKVLTHVRFEGSRAGCQADVAQLVERNLAKVEVASSSLVVRSEKGRRSPPIGGVAERRGNGLQIRLHGFKSRLHLDDPDSPAAGMPSRFGRLAQW